MKPLREITFTLRVDLGEHEPPEGLVKEISRLLNERECGRRPFNVELMEVGIAGLIRSAVYQAISHTCYAVHGNEMVQVTPTSQTARAHLEAERRFEGFRTSIYGAISCKSIETYHEPKTVSPWLPEADEKCPVGLPFSLWPSKDDHRLFSYDFRAIRDVMWQFEEELGHFCDAEETNRLFALIVEKFPGYEFKRDGSILDVWRRSR